MSPSPASSVTSSTAATAAERLRVRSALNPILWLAAIAATPCFGAAYAFRDYPAVMAILIAAGVAPIGVGCGMFVYFAFTKPEKLQSEDYQLRHEALQIIQQSTGHGVIDLRTVEAIANPAAAAPTPEEKE